MFEETGVRTSLAYGALILLWSATPLAIKWSGEGPGYLFGVTARMSLGLLCCGLFMLLAHQALPINRKALKAYGASSIQVYGSMLATYWGAQHIPSGWVSVMFGLTPLITAPMAAWWLGERSLTPSRMLSYLLGIAGLIIVFHSALSFSVTAVWGISAVLLASFLQALSSVWVKHINAPLPAMTLVTGGLTLSVPLYFVTWIALDGHWPDEWPLVSTGSILFLGIIATPIGFALYYFILNRLAASRVALITLVTPVLSLLLGNLANGEALHDGVIQGAALILGALMLHNSSPDRPPRTGHRQTRRSRRVKRSRRN